MVRCVLPTFPTADACASLSFALPPVLLASWGLTGAPASQATQPAPSSRVNPLSVITPPARLEDV